MGESPPPPPIQNRACAFERTRLLSGLALVMGTPLCGSVNPSLEAEDVPLDWLRTIGWGAFSSPAHPVPMHKAQSRTTVNQSPTWRRMIEIRFFRRRANTRREASPPISARSRAPRHIPTSSTPRSNKTTQIHATAKGRTPSKRSLVILFQHGSPKLPGIEPIGVKKARRVS